MFLKLQFQSKRNKNSTFLNFTTYLVASYFTPKMRIKKKKKLNLKKKEKETLKNEKPSTVQPQDLGEEIEKVFILDRKTKQSIISHLIYT